MQHLLLSRLLLVVTGGVLGGIATAGCSGDDQPETSSTGASGAAGAAGGAAGGGAGDGGSAGGGAGGASGAGTGGTGGGAGGAGASGGTGGAGASGGTGGAGASGGKGGGGIGGGGTGGTAGASGTAGSAGGGAGGTGGAAGAGGKGGFVDAACTMTSETCTCGPGTYCTSCSTPSGVEPCCVPCGAIPGRPIVVSGAVRIASLRLRADWALDGSAGGAYHCSMTALRDLAGTKWSGRAEVWLDPLGNEVDTCECRLDVETDRVQYHWSYERKPHVGRVVFRPGGVDFTDSWHSVSAMVCVTAPSPWAMIDVLGTYDGGEGLEWGWRILLALRPSDELVLQMTNVTPWGEEGRAVRMICQRA